MGRDKASEMVPPSNFFMVREGIYRSALPQISHLLFLQNLKLRSIIYLSPEPYPQENSHFLQSNNIKLFHLRIQGTKESSVTDLSNPITEALKVITGTSLVDVSLAGLDQEFIFLMILNKL